MERAMASIPEIEVGNVSETNSSMPLLIEDEMKDL
jgi:hypothetical protein